MLNFFRTHSPVGREILNRILQETFSTRLENKGFIWNQDSLWFTGNKNSIRQVLKYVKLKGEQGTFSWGVCLDFVPTISGNKIKYHLTDKSVTLHLFEWTDQYMNSLYGDQPANDFTTHWGENEARRSISTLFNNYEKRIFDWFEKANSIDNLTKIAESQIKAGKSYGLHSPDPRFILAFLQARAGDADKALLSLEQSNEYKGNGELETKLRQELTKLSI
jgi:hypothetical protein